MLAGTAQAVLALALSIPSPESSGPPAQAASGEAIWRAARNCGPNCLYLMLSSVGEEVSYEALTEAVVVGPKGTSLLEIRDAALSLGHDVEVYKGTPEDLAVIPLPVILHLDKETGDVQQMGHFVLLTEYDRETREATVFDGVTAAPMALSFESLRRMWSGYLLAPKAPSPLGPFLTSMAGTMALCLVSMLFLRRRPC